MPDFLQISAVIGTFLALCMYFLDIYPLLKNPSIETAAVIGSYLTHGLSIPITLTDGVNTLVFLIEL
jgi:hypothetical protein